jgi:thiosulfate dehydrogenase [quinone] large subunit
VAVADISKKTASKQTTYLLYLAIPRIFVGYHFIGVAWAKLSRGFLNGKDLSAQLLQTVGKDPVGWHRHFILGFVLPHSAFFSYLVPLGELAIGISLVLGCLVRLSSLFGAFHNLNILFAIALASSGAQVAVNEIFIVLHLMFVFASAGRVIGMDCILKKGFPRSWLF